jgi:hypothetical protein
MSPSGIGFGFRLRAMFWRYVLWYVRLAAFVMAMMALKFTTGMSDVAINATAAALVAGYICWLIWRSRSIETRRKLISGASRFVRWAGRYVRWAGVSLLAFGALWFALRVIHWAWETPFPFGG